MSNSFYNHATYPAPNAPGSSAALRAELDLVTAGFNKLPTLAANGYKVAMVNAAGTALIASSALQSLAITGSTLDSTPIGATTRAAGSFTNLSVNGSAGLGTAVTIGGGTIDNTPIGGTTASSGAFTTVSASSGFTGNLTGNVTGDVTGNLTGNVSGNVTAGSGTSTFNNVTINGTLDMNAGTTGTITGLANPVNASDAANKGYVDTVAQGLDVKPSVRVATTASITLSGEQTIDGVAVIAGDRVLVKDQSTASTNGVYVAAAGSWARAVDMDVWAELPGAFLFVEEGTANDNSGWVCTVAAGGTIGSTSVTFEQFSGAGQITAGAGMTKSGNTLNVGTASASRIVVNADNIDLAASGVTASTYKSVTVDIYGRVTAGTNPTTLAGYGITDAYTIAQVDSIFASTTSAAASAAAAAASELAAGNSATAASGSASSASASATAAAASYDSFDDRYLGAKTSDPTVDNDGNALITGALYFNSSAGEMRVYNGSAWVAAYLPAAGYLPISGGTLTGNLLVNAGTDSRYLLQVSGTTQAQLQATASAIRLASNNTTSLVLATNGVDRVTFDSAGNTTFGSVSASGVFKVQGLNTGDLVVFESTDASGTAAPDVVLYRNSSTPAAADQLGVLVWRGKDSDAADQQYARIGAEIVDPTAGSEDGSLWFETVIAGASVERMRLAAAGLGIGTATPARPVHIKTTTGGAEMRFEATAPGGLFSIGASSAANAFVINDNNASATRFQINASGAIAFTSSGNGTTGQVLTSAGSGAAPTWSSPAAGGTTEFVATGAISNGQTVALRSDGTVEVVSGSFVAQASGPLAPVPNTNSQYHGATYDSVNNVVLVSYMGTANNNAYIVAGTVSGTTITFGTEVLLSNAYQADPNIPVVYDAINQVGVVAARASSSLTVRLVSFTVSGTVITIRQTTTTSNTTSGWLDLACSTTTGGSFLLSFIENATNKWQRFMAFTVTNLGVFSLGSEGAQIAVDSNFRQPIVSFSPVLNRFLLGNYAGSGNYTFYITQVTGTTVTLGSSASTGPFSSGAANSCIYCPEIDKFALCYRNGSGYPSVRLVTATLSSITFEPALVVASVSENAQLQWSPAAGVLAVSWRNGSSWLAAPISISGTTLTLGTTTTIASGDVYNSYTPGAAQIPTGRVAFFRQNDGGTRYMNGAVLQTSYAITNAANYIGIAAQAISSGASGNVTIAGGVNSGVSGLTANTKYYVQVNGTIGTTNAGYPLVGRAIAANKILVTNSLN